MVLINHAAREMTAKVVYYGPGLCGKTTNLLKLHEVLPSEKKGKMLSLATKQDRTLFFDLLPVEVGKIKGMSVRIQLYTVPGQVFYDETRRLVLKGADAVVFVVDSQEQMVDANRESFQNLKDNLQENGIDFDTLPIFVQYNKRDLPNVLPVEELIDKLNMEDFPYQDAIAITGEGVRETFHQVVQLLMGKLAGKPIHGKEAVKKPAKTKAAPEEKKGEEAAVLEEAETAPEVPEEAPLEIELPSSSPNLEETYPGAEDGPLRISEQHDYDAVEEVDLTALIEERRRSTQVVPSDEEVLDLQPDQIIEDEGEEDEPVREETSGPDPVEVDMESAIIPDETEKEEPSPEKEIPSGPDEVKAISDKIETLIVKLEDLKEQITDIIDYLRE